MQMMSAGAMGGGISSAIARALGGGRRDEADAALLHALVDRRRRSALVFMVAILPVAVRFTRAWAARARRSTRR